MVTIRGAVYGAITADFWSAGGAGITFTNALLDISGSSAVTLERRAVLHDKAE